MGACKGMGDQATLSGCLIHALASLTMARCFWYGGAHA